MLAFQTIYDVMMLSWVSVLFLATIYKCKSCLSKKGKLSDDFDDLDKKETYKPNLTKNIKSFSNFDNYQDLKNEELENDNIRYNSTPIQKRSNECFRCNQKLYSYFNQRDFYAFDKQVCETCWNNLKRNVVNNHL